MRQSARVVIVGGGVSGLSALYHLTQEGWTDVMLVERNELTSGTTWHSAAQCPQLAFNQLLLLLRQYTIGLYKELADDPEYPNYLYWMQFNNNFQSALFMKMAYQAGGGDLAAGGQVVDVMQRREEGLYTVLEQRLGESEYLGAQRFTCADIMSMFNLTSLEMLGARPIDESLPNTKAYVERISARPAYQKAMEIAGPAAAPPVV